MILRTLILPLFALMLFACSANQASVQTPSDHPASPRAAESAYTPPANVLLAEGTASPATTGAAGHDEHESHAKADDHDHHHATGAGEADENHADHHEHAAGESAQESVDKLVAAYLALSDLLANDKFDGSEKQLSIIHHTAHDLSDADQEKVAAIAEKIAKVAHGKAEDIKAMRASFKAMSPDVVELAHLMPPSAKVAPEIRQAYCPMAKAPWLQLGEKVTNPYFGSEMLRCGKITETLKPKDEHHK
ncbi:MAG: DUF3347 domain-containing protein [Planctomycetes bacterium]|nr:DUF3347 domain-containing protein [Planctomycetota bacterium]